MHASGGWDRAAWKAFWPPPVESCRSACGAAGMVGLVRRCFGRTRQDWSALADWIRGTIFSNGAPDACKLGRTTAPPSGVVHRGPRQPSAKPKHSPTRAVLCFAILRPRLMADLDRPPEMIPLLGRDQGGALPPPAGRRAETADRRSLEIPETCGRPGGSVGDRPQRWDWPYFGLASRIGASSGNVASPSLPSSRYWIFNCLTTPGAGSPPKAVL